MQLRSKGVSIPDESCRRSSYFGVVVRQVPFEPFEDKSEAVGNLRTAFVPSCFRRQVQEKRRRQGVEVSGMSTHVTYSTACRNGWVPKKICAFSHGTFPVSSHAGQHPAQTLPYPFMLLFRSFGLRSKRGAGSVPHRSS